MQHFAFLSLFSSFSSSHFYEILIFHMNAHNQPPLLLSIGWPGQNAY